MRIIDTLGRAFQAGLIAEVPTGRLVWVDPVHGNDALAVRERMTVPFKTLTAAKNAASGGPPGDTIIVLPGTYDEKNLLKNGVNWHFLPGAKVIYSGGSAGGIFDTGTNGSNGAVSSQITGWGQFEVQGSQSTGHVINSAVDGSSLYLEAHNLSAAAAAVIHAGASAAGPLTVKVATSITGGGSYIIHVEGGAKNYVEADQVGSSTWAVVVSGGGLYLRAKTLWSSSHAAVAVNGGSGEIVVHAQDLYSDAYVAVLYASTAGATLRIINARIRSSGSSTTGRAIDIRSSIGSATPARVKLSGCVLLAAGDYSIAAAQSGTKVQLNGGGATDKTWQNVTFVGGGSLGTASTDVS